MINASEAELLALLRDIDGKLGGEKPESQVNLYILGGAAAVIAYDSPRGTMDIDAYLEDRRVSRRFQEWAGEGKELSIKHGGIYFHPANLTIMLIEDPDWRERASEFYAGQFKNMKLFVISKEDLILSKLSRYNDRDREDINFLAKNNAIDPEKLIVYYESARQYFAGNLRFLDQTFNIVLEENFKHKPVQFGA